MHSIAEQDRAGQGRAGQCVVLGCVVLRCVALDCTAHALLPARGQCVPRRADGTRLGHSGPRRTPAGVVWTSGAGTVR